ncbi:zinc-ribbon domain-containing protein [Methanosarcina sp.]|uniref:zinc-ribbon domain-containing protein n=1 Tax=Methanosarcina sp. TaxID=2213 RepID=UPI003BB69F1A
MWNIYCSNCGLKVDSEDLFCSGCGKELKYKPDIEEYENCISTFGELGFTKKVNCRDKGKNSILAYCPKNILTIGLISVFGCLLIFCSTFVLVSDLYFCGNSSDTHNKLLEERNIQICERIATEYYGSHTYSEDDIYDCDNMAQDVWNMLKAKGIDAKIAVGNFEPGTQSKIEEGKIVLKNMNYGSPGEIKPYNYSYQDSGLLNSSTIDSLTHAWILAEVSPGSWLAIECTGGYVVYSEENEDYYRGLTFNNPKNYRSFLDLYGDWKMETLDYENERLYCNKLADTYKNANYSEQVALKSSVEIAEVKLQEKKQRFQKTDSELKALLQYG